MKKIVAIIICMLLALPILAAAAEETNESLFDVYVDGVKVEMGDAATFMTSGKRLYIPIRPLYEHLGYEVNWDFQTSSVTVKKGDTTLQMPVGSKDVFLNGEKKTADVAILNKNGKTAVSAMLLTICHGYYLRWDNISMRLDVMSPEYFGNQALFTQNTFDKANGTNPDYDTFNSMSERVFLIPGLNEYVVPQGLAYSEKNNCFYLSGYFQTSMRRSVVCVVDASTGLAVGEYELNHIDGKPHYGHVGGIAVSEKDIYLAHGKKAQRISLNTIANAGPKGELQVEEDIILYGTSTAGNSFLDCSGGYLWAGNYYDIDGYENVANENYTSLIRGYKLDPAEPSGISAELKTQYTTSYDYVPSVIYNVPEGRIQGMTTTQNHLILAASKSTKFSYLYVYDRNKIDPRKDSIVFDRNKIVPVYKLSLGKSVYVIPRIEELTSAGESIYATFESGAIIYRPNSVNCATDSVWKIDLNKLLQ